MTSAERDLDEIDQLLDEACCEDPHMKSILDPKLAEKHPIIAETMAEARQELIKMLEIVLLGKPSDDLSAK